MVNFVKKLTGLIKVSVVSYLNSRPFMHGISEKLDKSQFDVSYDIPAECARKLLEDKVDIGLVPVAVLPLMKEKFIVSDYCIGAEGKVTSVMLYSEVPLTQIKTIVLDFHSRTSVALARVLAKFFWKIEPEFIHAKNEEELNCKDYTAVVMIGDRTFKQNGKHLFEYDLSEEWEKFTGLPFVFACWVANKPLDPVRLIEFNAALTHGVQNINKILPQLQNEYARVNVIDYLTQRIKYNFSENHKKALELFQSYLNSV